MGIHHFYHQPPFNRLFLVGPFPLVWEFPIWEKHNLFANSSQWDPFCRVFMVPTCPRGGSMLNLLVMILLVTLAFDTENMGAIPKIGDSKTICFPMKNMTLF